MEIKICAVTGHRDIASDQIENVRERLYGEIERAIADGFTWFISGFAEGADQYFAEIVAEKRKKNQALRLEAALPYRNRYITLLKNEKTKALLEFCTDISVISENYAPNVYMVRNRYMVDKADRIIAVYDGREKGGTASTIRMIHVKRKEMREIPVGLYL